MSDVVFLRRWEFAGYWGSATGEPTIYKRRECVIALESVPAIVAKMEEMAKLGLMCEPTPIKVIHSEVHATIGESVANLIGFFVLEQPLVFSGKDGEVSRWVIYGGADTFEELLACGIRVDSFQSKINPNDNLGGGDTRA